MHCLCVNVYCTTVTGYQPNCSKQIYKYHVISYIVSYINIKVDIEEIYWDGVDRINVV
jgi:hypothetical protein